MASVEKDPWKAKGGECVLTAPWCLLITAFLKPSFKPHPNHQRCLWKSVLLVDEKNGGPCQVETRFVLEGTRQEVVRSKFMEALK